MIASKKITLNPILFGIIVKKEYVREVVLGVKFLYTSAIFSIIFFG